MCMFMGTQVHEGYHQLIIIAEFVLKSCRFAPPILIIMGLWVIITAGGKINQINIYIQLNIFSKGNQNKMVSPRDRWKLNRTEPQGLELFEVIPKIRDVFIRAEWYDFICAFEGHHTGVALLFAKNLMGFRPNSGTPPFISQIISLGWPVLSRSVGRDGSKRENFHQSFATNSWCQNTKTLTGVKVFPSCG
jgi:hypothetical protein